MFPLSLVQHMFPHRHHSKFFDAPGRPEKKSYQGGPTVDHNQLICKLAVLQIHSYKQEVADTDGNVTDIYQILLSPGCKQPFATQLKPCQDI